MNKVFAGLVATGVGLAATAAFAGGDGLNDVVSISSYFNPACMVTVRAFARNAIDFKVRVKCHGIVLLLRKAGTKKRRPNEVRETLNE